MAVFSGPEIPNDGLIFSLDAANPKNFDLTAVEVLVVGGGGSGAQAHGTNTVGGGGGGGVVHKKNHAVTPGTSHTVTIGAGGTAPGTNYVAGVNGGNSVFDTLTALGGGGGGVTNGVTGGSGSGAGSYNGSASAPFSGAAATQPGSSSGGFGYSGANCKGDGGGGGGGGGAGGPGEYSSGFNGGAGGIGYFTTISGVPEYYAGGGGGTGWEANPAGLGGLGGGGNGATRGTGTVTNATPNTGGGGGSSKNGYGEVGGNGGSGIVIVRYPAPQRAIGGTVTQVGNDIVHTFTTVGNSTFTPISSSNLVGLTDLTTTRYITALNGPTYNSGNIGYLNFDGTDDYLSAGAITTAALSFTVLVWFYPTVVANFKNVLDCNYNYNATTGNIGPRLEMNSSGRLVWTYSNNTTDNGSSYSHEVLSSGLSANTWHCAAITYNGSSSTTYYNGINTGLSRTTAGSPTGFIGVMNNLIIGRGFHLDTHAVRGFTGRIPTVLIYNSALTSNQILEIFSASRDRYGV